MMLVVAVWLLAFVIFPSHCSNQVESYGKCEFSYDCDKQCKNMYDVYCVCNQGSCVVRVNPGFIRHLLPPECKTLQDCKNLGKCKGVPDSQCFCIDERCNTRYEWECHESTDCTKMEKCRGKKCFCKEGTCEFDCYADEDCYNGLHGYQCYESLGYHCKCQNGQCNRVKLPPQCTGIEECIQKNLCKSNQPCECLHDYCKTPWYVEKNVMIEGFGYTDYNCRTTQDCEDTILVCADGSCICGALVEKAKWAITNNITNNKRGTCIKTGSNISQK